MLTLYEMVRFCCFALAPRTSTKSISALVYLLSIRSHMSFETDMLPATTKAKNVIPCGHGDSKNRLELPVEIWAEILQWVPRCDLKVLLNVLHQLRGPASELYFRKIVLHFDVPYPRFLVMNPDIAHSRALHTQRSLEILTRILRDVPFARRVKTLKVLIDADVCLDFEMGGLFIDSLDLLILTRERPNFQSLD
jgi:hypothetical protein